MLFSAAPLAAQSVKLSAPLARPVGGDIRSFQVSADGDRAVYLADQDEDNVFELFAVKPGSQPIRLSQPLPAGRNVDSFLLAPDASRAVYVARLDAGFELFSVPVNGGVSIQLSPELVAGGSVATLSIQVSADSRRAVFEAEALVENQFDLFSAPLDGSAPAVRLNRTSDRVLPVRWLAPDSAHVVFQMLTGGGCRLFSVPLDGSADPLALTDVLEGSFNLSVAITPDGHRVLLVAGDELHSVPIDASAPPVVLSTEGREVSSYRILPDSGRAVYRARVGIRDRSELFVVAVAGGAAPVPLGADNTTFEEWGLDVEGRHALYIDEDGRLASLPVNGGAAPVEIHAGPVRSFQAVPDERVVFEFDNDPVPGNPHERELHVAASGGGAPSTHLATAAISGAPLEYRAAGENLVYRSQTAAPYYELFGVPLDGSAAPRTLNLPMVAEREVQPAFKLSADGELAFFSADLSTDESFDLFRSPVDGSGKAQKLNPPLPTGRVEGDVMQARHTPDGERAVYLADQDEDEVFELFSTRARGGEAPVQLNAPLVPGGDVERFELTSGDRLLYLADQDTTDVRELYSVDVRGGGPAVRLNAPLSSSAPEDQGIAPANFRVAPDGSHVVYLADQDVDRVYQLYSAPLDGSAASIALSPALPIELQFSFAVAPRSDYVVYREDPDGEGIEDLFSVPIAGGSPPVQLNAPLPAGNWQQLEYALSADGTRVVYAAEQIAVGKRELFSVPIDRSSGPIRISGGLPAHADVGRFELTPDGTFAVFSADPFHDGSFELFSVPVAGGAAPRRLHTPSAAYLRISPDGDRVVFLVGGPPYEIHSVPIDASSPSVRLSPAVLFESVYGSTSRPFAISADGEQVVYRAGTQSYADFQLYGVPIDASAPPVQLSVAASGRQVLPDFQIAPDARTVLYRSEWSFREELLRVPIDGSAAPRPISSFEGRNYGNVNGFELHPDGERVLLLADQDSYGVIELYASALKRVPRPASMPVRTVSR